MPGHDSMYFGGIGMWLLWLIVIVVAILIVRVIVAGGSAATGTRQKQDETPLEILRKRYARGEIDETEYNRRREELERR